MTLVRALGMCGIAVAIAGCATVPEATDFPLQPVKIVIPYPVGNAADLVGRIMADKLAQLWGRPVVVENRAGPTTVPGVDSVAKAKPDGYTLMVHSISYAVDASLYTRLPFDPARDLVAVAGFARQPFVLVAAPSAGAKSVADLVSRARQSPPKYASLGTTTQIYFVAEQFRRRAGFNATNVTFKSLVDANGAVARGEAAFWFPPVAGAAQAVREGKLVPLAVTAGARSPLLPQVPTMAEAGIRDMESHAWFGLWAPAGTPPGVVNKIARDVERALDAPDVAASLAKIGAETMKMGPSRFTRFVADETEASRRFIGELGIQPQAYVAPPRP